MNADAGTSCVGAGHDTDFENVDAILGSPSANGGPTPTHMLFGPSQLIDADPAPCIGGTDPTPLTTDQRGFPRPIGAGCDIGAVEVNLPGPPTLSGFNPDSPANDNTPEVTGNAPSGTTVNIFMGNGCTGPLVAAVTAAQLASPGATVSVSDNSTTPFSANAVNSDGSSPCSNSISYVERSPTARPRRCAGVKATRVGSAGRNTIIGTNKRDVIVALGGNDTVRGRGGNDIICLGAGNDRASGGGGKDTLLGAAGRDTLLGGAGRDLLNAAAGRRELCNGGPARDRFRGCERVRGRP